MLAIKGIRLESIHVTADKDEGGYKLSSAEYALISAADKVLAKQSIGGYNDVKIEASPATVQAMNAFVKSYLSDINITLGFDAE